MSEIIFLTLEQILVIHDNQIETYGGDHGVRDFSLLESAVVRLQTTFAGKELYSTIYDKAAALIHSLILNHPFIDGNKRTGVASVIIFLEINGLKLDVVPNDLEKLAIDIATNAIDLHYISSWFKTHTQ